MPMPAPGSFTTAEPMGGCLLFCARPLVGIGAILQGGIAHPVLNRRVACYIDFMFGTDGDIGGSIHAIACPVIAMHPDLLSGRIEFQRGIVQSESWSAIRRACYIDIVFLIQCNGGCL